MELAGYSDWIMRMGSVAGASTSQNIAYPGHSHFQNIPRITITGPSGRMWLDWVNSSNSLAQNFCSDHTAYVCWTRLTLQGMVSCCQGQKSKQPEESCFLLTINTCQFSEVRPWFDTTHFTTFPDLLTNQFTSFCYNCIFQADQPSEWAWQRPSLPVVRHLGIHVFRREHVRPMLLVLRINKRNFLETVIWVIDMYLHIHSLWQRKIMEGFQLANKLCMLMQFVWIFSKIFIWRERLIIAWIIVLFPKASLLWITHCYPSTMLAHHWILPWWIKCVFFFILNQCQRSKSC